MKEDNKVVLTIGLWFSIAGISIATMVSSDALNHAEMLVAGLVFMAFITTGFIWTRDATIEGDASQEKAKRSSEDKLALLMDLMDDEERQAFKETLKRQYANPDFSNDGEIPYTLYEDNYMEQK